MKIPFYIIVASSSGIENELVFGNDGENIFQSSSYEETVEFKDKVTKRYAEAYPVTYKILRCIEIFES